MSANGSLSFDEEFKNKKSIIEDALRRYLPPENEYPDVIHKAMHYSVFGDGKRIRPILTVAACEIFDKDISKVLPVACAIEYIHNYSLIHDDLPAMDNDDLRRGRPTSHKVFGEAVAVLAGDALLTHAFNIIFDAAQNSECPDRYLAVGAEIANACDTEGFIGGQAIDINSEHYIDSPEKLMDMDLKKTGCLISAGIAAGAIMGGAGSDEISALKGFGKKLGLAFQVEDDILDYKENETLPDKPTYTSMMGIGGARRYVRKLSDEAVADLKKFGLRAVFLNELTEKLVNRTV